MKLLLLTFFLIGIQPVFASQGTYVDSVQFIQYLDENTALEEVKNGNLDLYYYRISSDRIDTAKAREGLQIYDSTGGSYSILVNPAKSEKFNPFSIDEVRFALNYMIDRKLIVNELMGGFGLPMISNYGPYDPDYLFIMDELASFNFRYNPTLAEEIITKSLHDAGAEKINGLWTFNNEPIELTAFIRSDDPVRKSIGEILSSELEKIGFKVKKDFGDLNKAFVIVYGSDPKDLKWNFYTEGWGGRSAFVKYDSVGLGQMYAPWFSNMPGFNDPSYWNYENDYLDTLTQKIYTGNFTSIDERAQLFGKATAEGVDESVRIFLASKIDQYVVNENIKGVINDFGAGVPSRFTTINAQSNSDSLVIGVKQIYQASWNPIMGMSDIYSRQIWDTLYDPGVFRHPYTGDIIPIRTNWNVETAGPNGKLDVPEDSILWNPKTKSWENVEPGTKATSKVTFDLLLSNWHHGLPMDMNDILYSLYFTLEWGSESQEDDKTFDTEYTPRASPTVQTLIGIRPVDDHTIEVYVDYWHFDEGEIADWAGVWVSTPWEIMSAMEKAVTDGKVSFSRSGAVSKSVNWLSLIIPNDARIIQENLKEFKNIKFMPPALGSFDLDGNYILSRYESAINWIEKNDHAVISNGPFYFDRYSPESRTISIKAFDDESYPFQVGYWQEFEKIEFPKFTKISIPEIMTRGTSESIVIETDNASEIHYFISNSEGNIVSSGVQTLTDGYAEVILSEDITNSLTEGANDLKFFAVSESVLRPDIFSTSFFATSDSSELPTVTLEDSKESFVDSNYNGVIALTLGIIIVGVIGYIRYARKKSKSIQV